MSGAIKYYNDLGGNNDIAFGLSGGMFETDTHYFSPADESDATIGTPYGILDSGSSSNIAGGTNQDEAEFLTGDFEYAWRDQAGSTSTRIFIGARAEVLNWKRTAIQDLTSSDTYAGREESEFFGIGPRIGGSFETPFGANQNFGLVGALSGGVMFGDLDQSFHLDSSSSAFGDISDYSKTVVVPFVDAEIGVAAQVAPGVALQLGYQAGFTSGILRTATVCTDDGADDIKPYGDSCSDSKSDVFTHGAVIKLTAAL
jgi:hypothetical protein